MTVLAFPSLQTMFDLNGKPVRGAKVYFYEAGTLAATVVYKTATLDVPHAQPIIASGYGRFPAIFTDENSYRVRIYDAFDGLMEDVDGISGQASTDPGGGGGGTVDATALLITGDVLWNLRTGTRTGFVRVNGRTISSALGGGTERANADTADLFTYLWQNLPDVMAPVSGGRGGSAAADFGANKTLGLPDLRGRVPTGLDDMGSSLSARFNGGLFSPGSSPTTLAGAGGDAQHLLLLTQVPSHSHAVNDPGHSHSVGYSITSGAGVIQRAGPTDIINNLAPTTSVTTGITLALSGGDLTHNNLAPFMLGTYYMRL